MKKPRVVIADDHPLILEGLRRILEKEFDIVGAVADGHSLVGAAERLRPDAVVFDIGMPLLNGIDAAQHIHYSLPRVRLVAVSQHSDRNYIRAAFQAGATGYVLKQSAASDLLKGLKEALAGRFYLSEELRRNLPRSFLDPKRNPSDLFISELTPRQREVLQLVAEGKSAKEVAGVLGISVKTVEYHKAGIMQALGLKTTAELTRYALATGMLDE